MLLLLISQEVLDLSLVVSDSALVRGETPVGEAIEEEESGEAGELAHSLRVHCSEGEREGHRLFNSIYIDSNGVIHVDNLFTK